MTIIAQAPTPTAIVFGTDGWRAGSRRLHVEVRRCADGVARYVVERGEQARGCSSSRTTAVGLGAFAAAAAGHDIPASCPTWRSLDPR